MFFVGIVSCRDELYVMLLWLRQECRSLLRLAQPVFVVCSVVGVGMTGMPYLPNLCASVPICGRHISARRFCVFRVFCGNTLSVCSVGAAETAAPPIAAPTELTLAWDVVPQNSRNSQNLLLWMFSHGFHSTQNVRACFSPNSEFAEVCVRLVSSGGLRPPPQQEWVR